MVTRIEVELVCDVRTNTLSTFVQVQTGDGLEGVALGEGGKEGGRER